jgi:hypothetical protein
LDSSILPEEHRDYTGTLLPGELIKTPIPKGRKEKSKVVAAASWYYLFDSGNDSKSTNNYQNTGSNLFNNRGKRDVRPTKELKSRPINFCIVIEVCTLLG